MVEEDAKCWIFTSSGASPRLKVDRHLSLIHPDTKDMIMSEENIIII